MADQTVNSDNTTRIEKTGKEGYTVFVQDRLDRRQVSSLWEELIHSLHVDQPKQLIFDMAGVTGIDTAGVALLNYLEKLCQSLGTKFILRDMPPPISSFLDYIKKHTSADLNQEPQPAIDFITRIGEEVYKKSLGAKAFVEFLGNSLAAGFRQIVRPSEINLKEFLYQTQLAGVGAIPLLVMLALLLGALMVFQGMKDIMNFGSPVLIADMVAIAVTREMAPLVTGVVIAGRSGAGIAAEIGTMKLNEELDALKVHNFDVTNYLLLPRIFALLVAGPILTMIADAAGIFGGMITSRVVLNVAPLAFLDEARQILGPREIYFGLIKGAVFGGAVGIIGCFRGLQTWTVFESLGIQTTSAVVTSIFIIIFLDTIFTYVIQTYIS